jgi:protein-disulfide isomerase
MRFSPFLALALVIGAAGAAGGWWAMHGHGGEAAAPAQDTRLESQLADAGIDARQRGAIEALVRSYILEHPEVLPEAMEKLQAREAEARLAPLRGAIETPFPGAVLGNPQGKVTLVEFTDFACTYCRSSVADVEALVKANPDLRVVVRELPIIAPESEPAARMGLAAAAQGKYPAFHKAMFSGERPSSASIAAAATVAGVDSAAATAFAQAPGVHQELERNLGFARQLGISGTPAWSVGGKLMTGAVGREALQQAVNAARKG